MGTRSLLVEMNSDVYEQLAQAAPADRVDPDLFESDAERSLFDATSRLESQMGSYEDRLRALAGLRAPVGRFFDDVLVMAEEPSLRANRLGLMRRVASLFSDLADFRKIQAELPQGGAAQEAR